MASRARFQPLEDDAGQPPNAGIWQRLVPLTADSFVTALSQALDEQQPADGQTLTRT